LLICTCTGYLCPGVTSYVAEQLGLRTDVFLQDLVGLGCGAANSQPAGGASSFGCAASRSGGLCGGGSVFGGVLSG